MKKFDLLNKVVKVGLMVCAMVAGMHQASAQLTSFDVASGSSVTNSNPANVVTYTVDSFNIDGTYIDSAGLVNFGQGTIFTGAGITRFYNVDFTAGSSIFYAPEEVSNTLTINSGVNVNANGMLVLAPGANLVVNGVLTNAVLGVVATSTTLSGCSSYTPTLSLNISGGVMLYQWQSSPDNSTWSSVSGATNATYSPTVTTTTYYRCNTSTTNSSFTNSTPGVKLFEGPAPTPTITASGPLAFCIGGSVSLTGTGAAGNALQFNSSSFQGVTITPNASVTNLGMWYSHFTTEAWVYYSGSGTNSIIRKSGDYNMYISGNVLNAEIWPNGSAASWNKIVGSVTLTQNVWTHVAVTWDGTIATLYVNGVADPSPGVFLNAATPSDANLDLAYSDHYGNHLNGKLDEVRIWNLTRTASQISATMNLGVAAATTGLVADFKLDEGSGATTADATGNLAAGALLNSPTWEVPSTSPLGYNSYTWSPSSATTSTINVTTTTSNTVTVVDYNGCSGTSAATGVTVNPLPTITTTPSGGYAGCTAVSQTITASGAVTYTWSPSTALSATTGASVNANPSSSITYTVTGTNANGCVNTATVAVTVNPFPVVSAITGNTTLSTTITTTLADATGGGVWSSATTAVGTVGSSTGVVAGISVGSDVISYAVTTLGCTTTVTTNVTVKNPDNALSFDGSDDRVSLPALHTVSAGSGTFTIEGWIKMNAYTTGIFGSMIFGDERNGNGGINIAVDATGHIYTVKNGGGLSTSSYIVPLNTWTHVAFVQNSSSLVLYVNGALIGTLATTGNLLVETNDVSYFGAFTADFSTFSRQFNGTMDEFRIWNSALSQSTIQANMNCDVPQTGLTAYYRFDQGSAGGSNTGLTCVDDYSGNDMMGTAVNFALTGASSNYEQGAVGNCNTITLPSVGATSGTTHVCVSSTTTLSNTVSGGVWTSSAPATAFIGSTTGVITGVAAGTATITYTLNCTTDLVVVTVNPRPVPTFTAAPGATTCAGTSVTYTTQSGGGISTYVWSVPGTSGTDYNVTAGGIGTASNTATIQWVTPGPKTVTVNYSDVNGCTGVASATNTTTVNSLPVVSPITGNTTLSTTITTTLADVTAGGVWSSGTTAVGTIGSSTGVVTGLSSGTALISYTVSGGGCGTTVTTNVTVKTPNNALSFDGVNDYVSVTTLPSLTDFTLEYWIRIDGAGSGAVPRITSTQGDIFETGMTSLGTISYFVSGAWTAATTIGTSTWAHVAWVRSGTGLTVYKNGISVYTATVATTALPSTWFLAGRATLPGSEVGDITLDEVRIWNVARSAAQIQTNMNCDVAQNGNLVGYYRLDQGTAGGTNTGLTCVDDYSGNNNGGVATNMTLSGASSNYEIGAVGSCNTITLPAPGTTTGTFTVCAGSNTTLSNSVAGGVWSTASANASVVGSTGVVTGITGGTAPITYTLNCITNITTVTVNARPIPSYITAPTANTCTGSTVTYTTQSGGGISSYTWSVPGVSGTDYHITAGSTSSSSNTVDIQWVTTGNQTVTVNYVDANGCTGVSPATNTTSVNALPTPTFTAAPGANLCSSTSTTYTTQTGGGITNYVWTLAGASGTDYTIISGSTSSASNTVTVQWLTGGSKTVTVNYSNSGGCPGASPASNTTSVHLRPTPSFTTTPATPICSQTNATYTTQTGGGIGSYVWTLTGASGTDYNIISGSTSSVSNTVTVQWLTGVAKTATVNYTDINSCTGLSAATNTVTVNVRPVPTYTAIPSNPLCSSTNAVYSTQTGGGIGSYVWTIPGTVSTDYNIVGGSTSTNTVTLQWLTGGPKTVTVNYTDINSCTGTSPATVTTTVNVRPSPSFSPIPPAAICSGNNETYTTQTGGGIGSYVWTLSGVSGTDYSIISGSTSSASNTVTLQWITNGVKTVTVNYTDGNGCTGLSAASANTTVTVSPTPTFTSAPPATVCSSTSEVYTTQTGGGITNYVWTLSGTSGTDYSIIAGSTSSSSNTVTIQWLTGGAKTVTVNYTNAGGCAGTSPASSTVTVNVRPVPSFTVIPSNPLCSSTNATYTTQTGGGIGSYVWFLTGTAGTDYSIISGSTSSSSNTVTVQWLSAGTKTVSVNYSDINGCTGVSPAINTTTVNARPVPTFTSAPPSTICSSTNEVYTTQTGGGIGSYVWFLTGTSGVDYSVISGSTSSSSNTITVQWLTSGAKTVTVNYTNTSGCTGTSPAIATTTVNLRPVPSYVATPSTPICSSTGATYTTQTASSYSWTIPGTSGTDYNLTGGSTSSNSVTLQWLTSGAKTVTVNYTDVNGCTGLSPATNTVTVNVRPVPTFTATPTSPLCSSTNATYSTQTGGGIGSYVWSLTGASGTDYSIISGSTSSSSNTVTVQWLTSGTKTVTVNYTDINSCTGLSAATNTVTVNVRPAPSYTSTPSNPLCSSTNGVYTTQTGGGITNYVWTVPGTSGTDYSIIAGSTSSASNTVTLQWLTGGPQTVTVNYTDINGCTGVNPASVTTTVNVRPTPSFTAAPGSTTCAVTSTVYTTQTGGGIGSYVWSIPGTSGTDYVITAGSTATNTVTIQWITSGSKTVTVNYTDANGCTGLSAASNTTAIQLAPSITSVSPAIGVPTSSVTITGANFNTTSTNDIVYFGATKATVITATTNVLTVTVPTDATFSSVTVNNSACSLQGYSLNMYLPNYNNSAYIANTVDLDAHVDFTAGTGTQGVVMGDFDGDGKTDLGISNATANTVSVFLNTSTSGTITSGSFAGPVTLVGLSSPRIIAAGDIDGDGKLDIVVPNGISPTGFVTVFRNTSPSAGTISFAAAANTNVGNDPWNVAVGDIDGDGKVDIAAVNSLGANVSVLRNNSTPGTISLATAVNFTTGSTPQGVAIADVDGDGKAEMIVANTGSGNAYVFHNTSVVGTINSGSFAGPVTLTANGGSNNLGVADFDGDGKTDIAVANSLANNVSVFRNTNTVAGTVSFATKSDFGTGSGPNTVGIGDFDGDGKPDIATSNSAAGTNTISILRNTSTSGTISFATKADYGTGTSSTNLAVGDLDGDGKADVAVANFGSNNVSVLRNDPLQPITGTMHVCIGGTTTLSEVGPNGTWSSSNAAIGSVGSASGIVTGVTGGLINITYTEQGGFVTAAFTVDPGPAITGTTSVCIGGVTSLTNGTPGGTWSSSNTSLATVGSLTGDVTGVATGIPTISYTIGVCSTLQPVTVNPLPVASYTVTPNSFCIGTATTFNASSAGVTSYAWNFGDGGTSTINGVSYTYTSSGNFTSSLVVTNTFGCTATSNIIVTVNPLPTAVTGTLTVCKGYTTTVSDGTGGGTWSSSAPGTATVNSTTGIVTGVNPGTATMTYSLPTGCTASAIVTVNDVPVAITGTFNVCPGTNTTLSDATTLGTWSTSDATQATIGSASGFVTGVAAGNPFISYTITATGCYITTPFTVNPLPAPIAGTLAVCIGSSSTLTDASTPGTWSSSVPANGSIVAGTGVMTGVAPGNTTITYTLSATGCFITAQATVNSNPTTITGTAVVCSGFTTTLNSTPGTGTWTSSDITLATIGSSSGIVNAIAPGNPTMTYSLGTGCNTSIVLTVNQTPAAISGTPVVCVGSSTTLSDATVGGSWSSINPTMGSIDPASGLLTGLSAGAPIIVYSMPTGCNASVTATINPLPAAIGGTPNVCAGFSTTLTDGTSGGAWTSSNPTVASVGTAGLVTGNTAGIATITYSLPTTCAISQSFTVNPTPAAITGTPVVCVGLNTTLANATTGGNWTSGSGNATVVGSTGVVTGVNAGTATIIYTLPAGCTATQVVTINPSPAPIVGASAVCVGLSTTLTNSVSGGTWSSSNAAQGSVGTTGIVTGIAAGTPVISYTLPAGCFAVQPMTVNPTPAAITGTLVVCQNSTVTLNDVTGGGVWTSSATAVGTIGSATGTLAGISGGTTTVVYTLAAGCTASAIVTVNPAPDVSVFASSVTSQCSGLPATFTVNSTSLGIGSFTAMYNMSGATTTTGSTSTLAMGASTGTFNTSALTASGTTTITLTSLTNTFGCITNLSSSNTATTTTFPLPTAYNVLGTGSYCSGGAGLHVSLSNSVGGITYQLYIGGVATGIPVAGVFGPLDLGAQTAAGTYTVIGTNTTTSCTNNMTGSAVITINPLPTVYAISGGGSYCAGGSGVAVGMAATDIGTNYQLYNGATPTGSPVAGTGSTISFGPQTVAGIYTVIAINATTTCTNAMSGTAVVTINPLPAAISGSLTVCPANTTTLTDASTGGTWSSVNTAAATIGSSTGVVSGVAAGTSVISYVLPTGCTITANFTVNPLPAAITGTPVVCTGATTALTDATSGGTWSSSNAAIGSIGTSSGILTGVSTGNPLIVYTLPTGCSTTITATVNATPLAITGVNNVCTGFTTALSDLTTGGTWSSSNTLQGTINSVGVVSGLSTGVPIISYVVSTGCFVTMPVSVNATPLAITGTTSVCAGLTTTLNDGTAGGAWSSSNTAAGTVGSATGVVFGVAAGSTNISYTIPATGCFVSTPVTVNASPAAITGTLNVCIGNTTTLSDAVTGGNWTSSNVSVATIGSGTGVVSGLTAGSAVMSYTMPGACMTTATVVVNPLPSAIAGSANVCVGSATTLTDATTGGTWSSSNAAIGTISAGGSVTGISAGSLTITYALATGCTSTFAMTVNPLPSAITGTATVCAGSTTNLSDPSGSGTWTSSNTAVATVASTTGVVTGVIAGNSTITFALPTGCIATTIVTVNPTPVAIAGANTICTTLTTTLSDATTGGVWSSGNVSLATIGSTGVVTGVSPGVVLIAYTLPAGCSAILSMTVNPQPAAVSGAASVCTGLTTAFTDATTGGVWSSSNTAVATVGTTGIVLGVTPGLATIAYTLPAGCFSSQLLTVNLQPAAIAGTTNVCVGLTTILTDATGGGVWSSSNPSLGSIGSATGVVAGIASGSMTMSYTLPAGCSATTLFSVNPLPASITGTTTVCVAATQTLSDATGTGTWSSSNSSVATINSGGVITGIAAGTPRFTYTLPSGCIASIAGTVNALPTVFNVTGGGSFCSGGAGVDVALNNSTSGINYQLLNSGSAVGSALGGATGFAIDYGFMSAPGLYTVVATNAITGCSMNMSGSATISVNPVPTVFSVTGGGSYCSGGTGVAVGVGNSTTGINYQLYLAGTPIGSPVAGTGSPVGFGLKTAAGVYTVVATNVTTGCTSTMSGIATVVINPLPNVYTVTGGGGYCAGGTGVSIGLTNSDLSTSYQVFQGSTGSTIMTGTGSAISFGLFTASAVYSVTATNIATGCSTAMIGSAVVSVNPLPVNTFTMAPASGSYCAGGTGVNITLSSSASGVSYQLYYGLSPVGTAVAGTGSLISFGSQTGAGVYSVIATNTSTLCTATMTTTSTVTINPLPTVFAVTGGGGYCAGGTGVDVALASSVVGTTYTLLRGGVSTGSTILSTGIVDFGLQTIAGVYTISANSGGCINTMGGSVLVAVNPLPTAYAVSGTGSYCSGGTGLAVGLPSSDLGITYQLYLGTSTIGSPVAGTGAAISFGTEVAAGTYTIVATNVTTLCTKNMTGSAIISINPLPNVYTVTGGGSYCSGGTGLHVYLSGSDAGINYQLYNGSATAGAFVTGLGGVVDFGLHTSSGIRTAIATNPLTTCSVNMLSSATIVINPLPTVNPLTGGGSYCAGGTGVAIGMNPSQTGINYQLFNGTVASGASIPGTGFAINFGLETTAGTYTVVGTNPLSGCSNTMGGTEVVSINPLPSVFAITGGGSYCTGGTGVHVGLSGSTVGINYQLNIGGSPVGLPVPGTGSAMDFGLRVATGTYTVTAINPTTTCTNSMSGSTAITISAPLNIYTLTGGGGYCTGGSGVDISLTSSDAGVSYQLYVGSTPLGLPFDGTGSGIDYGNQTSVGTYAVVATNGTTGCTANMTGSPSVSLNPLPVAYAVSGGGNYCTGGTGVTVGLSNSTTGVSYQLSVGTLAIGAPLTGTTGSTLNFGLETMAGTYTIVGTSTAGCVNNMTGSAVVGINPLPLAHTVTGGGSYCAGGDGVYIGLNGSDAGINYQLVNGSSSVGSPLIGTGTILDFGLQTTAGAYTVAAINATTGCTSGMTGSAVVAINALPTAYAMTGGGSYCTGGAGVHVGLANSRIGGSYQLYLGTAVVGSPVAGTGTALDFGLQTAAGIYKVITTNGTTGCTNNMATMDTVVINALPATYTVTGGGSYCVGGTGYHVGLSGSVFGTTYQLYNGGTVVGAPVAGTGSSIDFGLLSVAGTYTVAAMNSSTSCTNNMTGSATINVNTLPAIHTITGGGSYCPGGVGVHIGLNGSDTGIHYVLYHGTAAMDTLTGSDSTLDFGLQTTAGAYTVVAANPASGCTSNMTGSATVIINTVPAVFTMTGGGGYCAGTPGTHVTLSSSVAGINYQLYRNDTLVGVPLAGTGLPLDLGLEAFTGSYTAVATSAATGCSSNMAGISIISINPLPIADTVLGGGSYCAGGTGLAISVSSSSTGIRYQLYNGSVVSGPALTGTGSSLSFGLHTAAGIYTVVATDPLTSCANTMLSSAAVAVDALPVVYTVTGGGHYCAAGAGVHVFTDSSQSGVNYQLYNGVTPVGSAIAGTGIILDLGPQVTPGSYTVIATNGTTTCTSTMAGSATVSIDATPAVYTVTGGGSYCNSGAGVHIGLSGSVSGVNYQLYDDTTAAGSAMSGTGAAIDFGLQTAAGRYGIKATTTATGCSSIMADSADVVINSLPAVFNVTGGGSYCAGTTGVHIGLDSSLVGTNYQLYHGTSAMGTEVSGSGASIDLGAVYAAGTYTVVAINGTTTCTNNMADSAMVTITPVVIPTASIAGTSDTVCAGTAVTYTAVLTNQGTTPVYNWMVNGISRSTTATLSYIPADHEVISVAVASSAACAIPDTAHGAMTMTVLSNVTPTAHITATPGDTVCQGTTVMLTATVVGGGTAPSYSWRLNSLVMSSASSYSFIPDNHDVVFLTVTSNYRCLAATAAISNNLAFTVQTTTAPVVAVTNTSAYATGGVVYNDTLTATVTNGVPATGYQWSVNGNAIVGATNDTYTVGSLADNDAVTCYVFDANACGTQHAIGTYFVTSANVGVVAVNAAGSNLSVIPNPNSGEFTVKGTLATTTDKEVTLELTDMLGQVIYTNKVTTVGGVIDQHVAIDHSIANGMYLLSVKSGDDTRVFHVVIER